MVSAGRERVTVFGLDTNVITDGMLYACEIGCAGTPTVRTSSPTPRSMRVRGAGCARTPGWRS